MRIHSPAFFSLFLGGTVVEVQLPVVIVELYALCELDLDDIPLLVPDGCPPVLRDVPLAAPDHLVEYSQKSSTFSASGFTGRFRHN